MLCTLLLVGNHFSNYLELHTKFTSLKSVGCSASAVHNFPLNCIVLLRQLVRLFTKTNTRVREIVYLKMVSYFITVVRYVNCKIQISPVLCN